MAVGIMRTRTKKPMTAALKPTDSVLDSILESIYQYKNLFLSNSIKLTIYLIVTSTSGTDKEEIVTSMIHGLK